MYSSIEYSKDFSFLQEKGREYYVELSELSESLRSSSDFNLLCLTSSILLMWVTLIALLFLLLQKFPKPKAATQYFLLLGTVLYGLSFTSTSMIEEEHQIWYFFWITFCILAMFESMNRRKFSAALPWIALMVVHRLLRKLNQTGDKWAMLPDIKSYLNSAENNFLLSLVFLMGMYICMVQ